MTLRATVMRAPKNPLSQPLAIRLLPDELAKTERFAQTEMRSLSLFIRIIFLRGLEAYERELAAHQ